MELISMTPDEKIDYIFGAIHEIKPKVDITVELTRAMDARQRFIETLVGQHDVKIERLVKDTDSLGSVLRMSLDKDRIRSAGNGNSGKWIKFLEALVILPKYVKILIPLGLSILGFLGMIFGFKNG